MARFYRFPFTTLFFFTQADKEIEQIDEIELTPYIQIQEVAEEVIVSGHLQLEGKYASKEVPSTDLLLNENQADKVGYTESFTFDPFSMDPADFSEEKDLLSFEHKIPVHIRIPRDKIVDLDQLYATIESFDYDIQSSRKLSISAELVLNGIESGELMEEEEAVPPASFEYVAAKNFGSQEEDHRPIPEHEVTGMAFEAMRKKEEQQAREEREAEAASEENEEGREDAETIEEESAVEAAEQEAEEAGEERKEEVAETLAKHEEEEREEQEEEEEEQEEQEEQPVSEIEEEREEEKKEARVAITLKGTKQDPVTVSPSTLAAAYANPEERSLANAAKLESAEASQESQRDEAWEKGEEEAKDDALYLTNFMNKEEESYTRLKMCIAQKDETLDVIAERYDITPGDIALANGLHTNATIAKGQVLYIPVKA